MQRIETAMASRKPNLIIFLPDQQRADTIGNPKVHAPNLTKLTSESIVFERAYVTQPVCSPSRASLMTGLWPRTTGCTQNGGEVDKKFRVLPELIGDRDYRTGYIGKWHLGPKGLIDRAFHERVSVLGQSDYSEFLISKGLKPDRKEGGFTELTVSNLPVELSQPKFVETRACEFIQRNRDRPFILVVAFVEPHTPYNGPLNDEHADVDVPPDISLTENAPLRYRLIREWQEDEALKDSTIRQFYFGVNKEDYRSLKEKYLGLVTLVDQSIGVILDCVEKARLSNNTIVVHTSDHGDMLGSHQLFGKEVMFEDAVRVPWMIRLAGQRAARIQQPVSHIDFVPTILDLLGKPKSSQCMGKSLAPVIRGESISAENVFVEWSPNWRTKIKQGSALGPRREIKRAVEESTRTVISPDGWKLSLRDKDLNELYNLNDDPLEGRNLYQDRQYAPIVARLAEEIRRWQKVTKDKIRLR